MEKTKYRVFKANIMDDDGNKVLKDSIVELSPKLAKHYNRLGFLRPVIEDDEDEEELEDAEPVGQIREPIKPTRSRIRRAGEASEQS